MKRDLEDVFGPHFQNHHRRYNQFLGNRRPPWQVFRDFHLYSHEPQGLGASGNPPPPKKNNLILQGGELTCFHFFKSS